MPAKMCENISPADLGQSVERRPFTVIVEGNIGSGKFETDTYILTYLTQISVYMLLYMLTSLKRHSSGHFYICL